MRAPRRTRHRAGCAVPPLPGNTAACAPWASATQMPRSRRGGSMVPRAPPAPSERQCANAALTGSGNISLPHIPRAPCRGNIPPWCVPERQVVAIFRRGAFSGARRWQNAREMRSPASDSGKISPRCVLGRRSVAFFSPHAFPKGPRTGKAPLPGSISPPCIRNEPALARYARHASEKPRKRAFGDAPRKDLARKGPFSLREPLRSCTARGSCRRFGKNTFKSSH